MNNLLSFLGFCFYVSFFEEIGLTVGTGEIYKAFIDGAAEMSG